MNIRRADTPLAPGTMARPPDATPALPSAAPVAEVARTTSPALATDGVDRSVTERASPEAPSALPDVPLPSSLAAPAAPGAEWSAAATARLTTPTDSDRAAITFLSSLPRTGRLTRAQSEQLHQLFERAAAEPGGFAAFQALYDRVAGADGPPTLVALAERARPTSVRTTLRESLSAAPQSLLPSDETGAAPRFDVRYAMLLLERPEASDSAATRTWQGRLDDLLRTAAGALPEGARRTIEAWATPANARALRALHVDAGEIEAFLLNGGRPSEGSRIAVAYQDATDGSGSYRAVNAMVSLMRLSELAASPSDLTTRIDAAEARMADRSLPSAERDLAARTYVDLMARRRALTEVAHDAHAARTAIPASADAARRAGVDRRIGSLERRLRTATLSAPERERLTRELERTRDTAGRYATRDEAALARWVTRHPAADLSAAPRSLRERAAESHDRFARAAIAVPVPNGAEALPPVLADAHEPAPAPRTTGTAPFDCAADSVRRAETLDPALTRSSDETTVRALSPGERARRSRHFSIAAGVSRTRHDVATDILRRRGAIDERGIVVRALSETVPPVGASDSALLGTRVRAGEAVIADNDLNIATLRVDQAVVPTSERALSISALASENASFVEESRAAATARADGAERGAERERVASERSRVMGDLVGARSDLTDLQSRRQAYEAEMASFRTRLAAWHEANDEAAGLEDGVRGRSRPSPPSPPVETVTAAEVSAARTRHDALRTAYDGLEARRVDLERTRASDALAASVATRFDAVVRPRPSSGDARHDAARALDDTLTREGSYVSLASEALTDARLDPAGPDLRAARARVLLSEASWHVGTLHARDVVARDRARERIDLGELRVATRGDALRTTERAGALDAEGSRAERERGFIEVEAARARAVTSRSAVDCLARAEAERTALPEGSAERRSLLSSTALTEVSVASAISGNLPSEAERLFHRAWARTGSHVGLRPSEYASETIDPSERATWAEPPQPLLQAVIRERVMEATLESVASSLHATYLPPSPGDGSGEPDLRVAGRSLEFARAIAAPGPETLAEANPVRRRVAEGVAAWDTALARLPVEMRERRESLSAERRRVEGEGTRLVGEAREAASGNVSWLAFYLRDDMADAVGGEAAGNMALLGNHFDRMLASEGALGDLLGPPHTSAERLDVLAAMAAVAHGIPPHDGSAASLTQARELLGRYGDRDTVARLFFGRAGAADSVLTRPESLTVAAFSSWDPAVLAYVRSGGPRVETGPDGHVRVSADFAETARHTSDVIVERALRGAERVVMAERNRELIDTSDWTWTRGLPDELRTVGRFLNRPAVFNLAMEIAFIEVATFGLGGALSAARGSVWAMRAATSAERLVESSTILRTSASGLRLLGRAWELPSAGARWVFSGIGSTLTGASRSARLARLLLTGSEHMVVGSLHMAQVVAAQHYLNTWARRTFGSASATAGFIEAATQVMTLQASAEVSGLTRALFGRYALNVGVGLAQSATPEIVAWYMMRSFPPGHVVTEADQRNIEETGFWLSQVVAIGVPTAVGTIGGARGRLRAVRERTASLLPEGTPTSSPEFRAAREHVDALLAREERALSGAATTPDELNAIAREAEAIPGARPEAVREWAASLRRRADTLGLPDPPSRSAPDFADRMRAHRRDIERLLVERNAARPAAERWLGDAAARDLAVQSTLELQMLRGVPAFNPRPDMSAAELERDLSERQTDLARRLENTGLDPISAERRAGEILTTWLLQRRADATSTAAGPRAPESVRGLSASERAAFATRLEGALTRLSERDAALAYRHDVEAIVSATGGGEGLRQRLLALGERRASMPFGEFWQAYRAALGEGTSEPERVEAIVFPLVERAAAQEVRTALLEARTTADSPSPEAAATIALFSLLRDAGFPPERAAALIRAEHPERSAGTGAPPVAPVVASEGASVLAAADQERLRSVLPLSEDEHTTLLSAAGHGTPPSATPFIGASRLRSGMGALEAMSAREREGFVRRLRTLPSAREQALALATLGARAEFSRAAEVRPTHGIVLPNGDVVPVPVDVSGLPRDVTGRIDPDALVTVAYAPDMLSDDVVATVRYGDLARIEWTGGEGVGRSRSGATREAVAGFVRLPGRSANEVRAVTAGGEGELRLHPDASLRPEAHARSAIDVPPAVERAYLDALAAMSESDRARVVELVLSTDTAELQNAVMRTVAAHGDAQSAETFVSGMRTLFPPSPTASEVLRITTLDGLQQYFTTSCGLASDQSSGAFADPLAALEMAIRGDEALAAEQAAGLREVGDTPVARTVTGVSGAGPSRERVVLPTASADTPAPRGVSYDDLQARWNATHARALAAAGVHLTVLPPPPRDSAEHAARLEAQLFAQLSDPTSFLPEGVLGAIMVRGIRVLNGVEVPAVVAHAVHFLRAEPAYTASGERDPARTVYWLRDSESGLTLRRTGAELIAATGGDGTMPGARLLDFAFRSVGTEVPAAERTAVLRDQLARAGGSAGVLARVTLGGEVRSVVVRSVERGADGRESFVLEDLETGAVSRQRASEIDLVEVATSRYRPSDRETLVPPSAPLAPVAPVRVSAAPARAVDAPVAPPPVTPTPHPEAAALARATGLPILRPAESEIRPADIDEDDVGSSADVFVMQLNGREVICKAFHANASDEYIVAEIASARALGSGPNAPSPEVYGIVEMPDGRRAYAMELVSGGFPERARAIIRDSTVASLAGRIHEIERRGYTIGDFQYFVTDDARVRVIDAGGASLVDADTHPLEHLDVTAETRGLRTLTFGARLGTGGDSPAGLRRSLVSGGEYSPLGRAGLPEAQRTAMIAAFDRIAAGSVVELAHGDNGDVWILERRQPQPAEGWAWTESRVSPDGTVSEVMTERFDADGARVAVHEPGATDVLAEVTLPPIAATLPRVPPPYRLPHNAVESAVRSFSRSVARTLNADHFAAVMSERSGRAIRRPNGTAYNHILELRNSQIACLGAIQALVTQYGPSPPAAVAQTLAAARMAYAIYTRALGSDAPGGPL